MKALFCKQLRLTMHPMTPVFSLFGCMLLIPNYPYSVAFFYVTLGIYFTFLNAREQRDGDYTSLLPVRKRDTVKCGILFSVGVELLSLVLAIPFALLSAKIKPDFNNLAGIDANMTLFAMGLLLFAAFNGIFFPSLYKTGYKVGAAFLKASVTTLLLVGVDVMLPHLLPWADGTDPRQIILLGIAAVLFGVASLLSYKISAKRYERVDL